MARMQRSEEGDDDDDDAMRRSYRGVGIGIGSFHDAVGGLVGCMRTVRCSAVMC